METAIASHKWPDAQAHAALAPLAQAQSGLKRATPAADRVKKQDQSYQISPYRQAPCSIMRAQPLIVPQYFALPSCRDADLDC